MIESILFVLYIALVIFVVVVVLPQLPRLMRVSFWTTLCVFQIVEGDAFFAAAYAVLATINYYEDD